MFKILWVQVEKTKLIETSKGHTIERHNNAHRHGGIVYLLDDTP